MELFMQKSLNEMIWNPRFYFMDEDVAGMYNEYHNEQKPFEKGRKLERLKTIPYYKEVLKELE